MARKYTLTQLELAIPVTLEIKSTPEVKAALQGLLDQLRPAEASRMAVSLGLKHDDAELVAAWQTLMAQVTVTAKLSRPNIQMGLIALEQGGEVLARCVTQKGEDSWIEPGRYLPFVQFIWSDQPDDERKRRQSTLSRALCTICEQVSYDIVDKGRGYYPAQTMQINLTKLLAWVADPDLTQEVWLDYRGTGPGGYEMLHDFAARVRAVLGEL